jgi:hypothetical protein
VGWHLGEKVTNKVKGEDAKWDPAAIGDAVATGIFHTRPGGLQMGV